MRAAICFFGITRNLQARTVRSIERCLFAPVAALDPRFVRFAHFNLPGRLLNSRSKESGIDLAADDHHALRCDHLETTPQAEVDDALDLGPFHAHGDPWADEFASMRNLLRQYGSLERVTRMLEGSGERFDLVIFSRADVRFTRKLDIPAIAPATLYTPRFAQWGGLNDRFALGDQPTMVKYGRRGRAAVDYVRTTQRPLHAEKFLAWYAQREALGDGALKVTFQRVRADGKVFGLDGPLRHLYALRSWLRARASARPHS